MNQQETTHHWITVGASVRGSSHEITGEPCQDAFAVNESIPGLLVGAVADGAGSAPRADQGAKVAVDWAVRAVTERLRGSDEAERHDAWWDELLANAVALARSALEEEAIRLAVPTGDLATTLMVFAATREIVAVAQVGDGAVVMQNGAGEFSACSRPQKGEYINETLFLTSDHWKNGLQKRVRRGCVAGVAAFSDGLERLCLNMSDGTPHAPFFRVLFRNLQEHGNGAEAQSDLEDLLKSDRVRDRTNDDLTLLLATLPTL